MATTTITLTDAEYKALLGALAAAIHFAEEDGSMPALSHAGTYRELHNKIASAAEQQA